MENSHCVERAMSENRHEEAVSESARFIVIRAAPTEMSCRYVGTCRYFDATGGCDLLFSREPAKHEDQLPPATR
jgi:hypothetical protein